MFQNLLVCHDSIGSSFPILFVDVVNYQTIFRTTHLGNLSRRISDADLQYVSTLVSSFAICFFKWDALQVDDYIDIEYLVKTDL